MSCPDKEGTVTRTPDRINPVQAQQMYSGFPELRPKLGPLSSQTREDTKHL